MIALILGTSEGREILSLLNKFTDNILISTATAYGGEILKNYKYKKLNTKPLNKEELSNMLKENQVNILIDASHPYALEVTKNAREVSKDLNIEYLRYERPSSAEEFKENKKVVFLEDYKDLNEALKNIKGNILNTSGSRNMNKILDLKLENRIIHRVLPSVKVLEDCFNLGVKVEDLMAIKGPISKELNKAFIKDYDAKALILKDSGPQGGTKEKILACLECNIYALVIRRKKINYEREFNNIEDLVEYISSMIN
ncbi:cobalt-precorrin-6A reductase [Clostridium sporogenes]|jgi:precorrin-6A/cobalt-precorrin-6A reductase|uniref:Cobalt-precorrin-6A reductase n=2 Tax=Clostridium TaxID=1485 RepID=A0AAE6LXK0_CLOSG|nr:MULTISPECIES: cobalt-precorrin-6A reductase [Clostridium]MBE6076918.1 cobalt-precorrin-6A reductase [Clostridium lundense]MDU2833551.1 cobalt-precorrin-6A reductase [Clostridium botulinum]EDU38797.1 precorrin-6A reductase [Clostridium sporogenes ATCC 15579]KIS22936.1 cobalt-precorrin-6X reductase [Clostridium botulinum B2 450]MCR1973870.1 cobalt-precorrin-6A reductase [Clostridium sporogenes]